MGGMDKVLREVQARPYSLKNVPIEALHAIWNGLCAHIHNVLSSGKGMTMNQFGTWSFHVDSVDLGTQRKIMRTPVFTLSERFQRLYNLRFTRGPSRISGSVPVRELNIMAIASASGQSRELVATALKDIFLYAGEACMSGSPLRLDFGPTGAFVCTGGGYCKFTFSPAFAGTFEEYLRPSTAPATRGGVTRGGTSHSRLRPSSSRHGQVAPPPLVPPQVAPAAASPAPAGSRPGSKAGGRPGTGGSRPPSRDARAARGEQLLAGPGRGPMGPGEDAIWSHRTRAGLGTPKVDGGVQVLVLRDPELEHDKVELSLRGAPSGTSGGELIVRQRNIGLEKIYPLHARVDVDKITAKFKGGALEISVPDKASSLRAFYAAQMRERDWIQKVVAEEEQTMIENDEKKTRDALELERQAVIARRKARAEVEAYNRKQAVVQNKLKDQFPMPDTYGYLLYNRKEYEGPVGTLAPDKLRDVLNTQIEFKASQLEKEKEKDKIMISTQVAELKKELEDTEREEMEEKRRRQRERMTVLNHQMEHLPEKLPAAFSAVCDFPRMDNEDKAKEKLRGDLRKIQDEVITQVHERGQQALENKKAQFRADMDEMQNMQNELQMEMAEKMATNHRQKLQNKNVWQAQIDTKRQEYAQEYFEPPYKTSLPIGEAELALVKTTRAQTVRA
uniref:CCDC81 HU domain-containing protein n=1 Tax=Hemiselmis tepida TaxID=464990 RepID=A0A7S0YJB4_9CRYP|mmetsp:Transcript_1208/g.3089  ORF Transcript_1208/g.3089 Transcript_1208/m.3089 type:complete len:674 (+) Transcript_1208:222-2243(+)